MSERGIMLCPMHQEIPHIILLCIHTVVPRQTSLKKQNRQQSGEGAACNHITMQITMGY